jgi:hypothetical protein
MVDKQVADRIPNDPHIVDFKSYLIRCPVGFRLRCGLLYLPQELASFSVLAHPYVPGAAGVCAVMEFLIIKGSSASPVHR